MKDIFCNFKFTIFWLEREFNFIKKEIYKGIGSQADEMLIIKNILKCKIKINKAFQ